MNITKGITNGSAAMKRGMAASHLGISPAHFDKLVRQGLMPSPRSAAGVKLWITEELEEALLELQPEEEAAPCVGDYALNI